jgi:AcrR family transcriptional regulator
MASVPTFFDDLGRLPPGRQVLPAEEVARQQRERMMAAMLDAVGEQGYIATTVADVLERAGVSRRTFYEHFDDREDCFLAAYDHVAGILSATMLEVLRERRPQAWADGVRVALDLFLHTVAAQPRLARACLVEILAVGPAGVARRGASLEPFARFVEAGRATAEDPAAVPGGVAETVVGGIVETVSMRVLHDRAGTVPELHDQLMYWALVPFVGPVAAGAALRRPPDLS